MADTSSNQITIEVDPETAEAYRAASEEDRRKMESLLGHKLRHLIRSQTSLKAYMDEVSRRAEQRGLTSERLKSLLHDE